MTEVLTLDGKLDANAATELHASLKPHLNADLTLDFAKVTELGALCLQTLIAAGIALREGGHQLTFLNIDKNVEMNMAWMGTAPAQVSEGRL
jgi:anti-anti-sigma regulatory factor